MGQLPDLTEYHNQTVREFEAILVRYLKGGKVSKNRPYVTIGGFLGIGGQKKVRLIRDLTRYQIDPCSTRLRMPLNSIRELSAVLQRLRRTHSHMDHRNKLRKTEEAVNQMRGKIDLGKAENYGFATLASVPYAHVVARMLADKHPKGTEITLAPPPKDLVCPFASAFGLSCGLTHPRPFRNAPDMVEHH